MPEIAKIIQNKALGGNLYRLVLESQSLQKAVPGQFVHFLVQSQAEPPTWDPLLRRPLSVYDLEEEKASFLYRIVGRGTKQLANRRPGEKIDLLGPLGRGFQITQDPALLIGGGVGAAPLLFLAHKLKEKQQKFVVLLGARTAQELAHAGDFAKYTQDLFLVTEDGSVGRRGLVTDFVPEVATQFKVRPKLYACGPNPMLASLAAFAKEAALPLDVSLEAAMACGVGACFGCACQLKDGSMARVCADGPVFPYEVLDWGEKNG